MKDSFGREIEYMRISLTDRCNLRCCYCMPHDVEFIPHESILSYEEILRICSVVKELGINRFKVTGGEPLVRKGCVNFIRSLKSMDGVEQVTMTTNGMLLGDCVDELADIGVDGINISLDSLNRERFLKITGRDGLDQVLRSVDLADRAGIHVKINCVPLNDLGEQEIGEFFEISRRRNVDVRFIEMMPIGFGREYSGMNLEKVKNVMKTLYPEGEMVTKRLGNGPANYYHPRGFVGSIGFIEAIHGKFCGNCNRIRLTSEGFLKTCLYYDHGTDLRGLLRGGASDEEIKEKIRQTIYAKPKEHAFGEKKEGAENRKMSQIGG